MAKGEPKRRDGTDNAEVSLETALKRCRALLKPHDPDAVVVLTKTVEMPPDKDGRVSEDDITICVPLGRTSIGHAILAQAAECGYWCKPAGLPIQIPAELLDSEDGDEEAEAD